MVKSSMQTAKEKIEVKKEDEWEDVNMQEKTGDSKCRHISRRKQVACVDREVNNARCKT